ncbi:hypothetical protein P280DRAFT_524244 [Massarina eburnea CBS 473.64]|uniref:Rhodopsin domain-containing protein n=1 Tax=Massarina eburnea CBS 473.64 TaxID=1395130 RepID=A0A6A6RIN3_9PLEO|nr:hypothetical protein P280DRAFT_524244 [Massarina eburnea CBS 473.64]
MSSSSSFYIHAGLAPPLVKHDTLMGVVWGGVILGTFALGFRYYVRIHHFRRLLPDDYVAGLAWLLLLAQAIVFQIFTPIIYEVTEIGAGIRPLNLNSIGDLVLKHMQGATTVQVLYHTELWSVKMSFLVFFYRLGGHVRGYRIAWWGVVAFTVATGCVCIGTVEWACFKDALKSSASMLFHSEHCTGDKAGRQQEIVMKVQCALNVSTDALIMMLPISFLWKSGISLRRRLALTGVFSLAVITMVFSIIRVTVFTDTNLNNRQSSVTRFELTRLFLWQAIETSVALQVPCLASFRTLFATKERTRIAEEALVRNKGEEDKAKSQYKIKVLQAKAKFLQESLFDTTKSAHAERSLDIESQGDNNKSKGGIVISNDDRRIEVNMKSDLCWELPLVNGSALDLSL